MECNDMFDLTGEVALVTGASSGLGNRFARVLAERGARVIVAARRRDRLDNLCTDIAARGGTAHAVQLDVADRTSITACFNEAEKVSGTVTLLVNNAGISGQAKALEMSDKDWRGLMAVNLDAVWYCAQEASRRMVAAKVPGNIINIASVLSFRVAASLAAYAVAKAGVAQMTGALALELARHNIRVNAIAPGYILTEINRAFFEGPGAEAMIRTIPQRRVGEPRDLDGTLMLLASNKASAFMTGSTIVVDGGQSPGLG